MKTSFLASESRSIANTFRFLCGDAEAIRRLAVEPKALATMIVLVFTAAIARNYDQRYFFENSFLWVFGPILFSGVAAFFHLAVIHLLFTKRLLQPDHPEYRFARFFPVFLTLFWATAPLAWIYAIPVERMTDLTTAAKWNVGFLGVVAAWRVALMARLLSVLIGTRFLKALGWVLVPASIEAFVVAIAGSNVGNAIAASMAGISNAPEETMILGILSAAIIGGPISLVAGFGFALVRDHRDRSELSEPPGRANTWSPQIWPIVLLVLGAVIAVPFQGELARNHEMERLIAEKRYGDAVEFLSNHRPEDFSPAKRLPPALYEYSIHRELPEVLDVLESTTPAWILEMYRGYLATYLSFRFHMAPSDLALDKILNFIERIPPPPGWMEKQALELAYVLEVTVWSLEPDAKTNLLQQAGRLGIPVPEEP